MEIIEEQKALCLKYSVPFVACPSNLKVGISTNVRKGELPIHGLRHKPERDTTGWFIWAGEYSSEPDFFKPLHVEHIKKWCPWILKYLGLPLGWRFLVTPDYEDLWEDISLLED